MPPTIPQQLKRLLRSALRILGTKPIDRHAHWQSTHLESLPGEMGWFQAVPRLSLELISLAERGGPRNLNNLDKWISCSVGA